MLCVVKPKTLWYHYVTGYSSPTSLFLSLCMPNIYQFLSSISWLFNGSIERILNWEWNRSCWIGNACFVQEKTRLKLEATIEGGIIMKKKMSNRKIDQTNVNEKLQNLTFEQKLEIIFNMYLLSPVWPNVRVKVAKFPPKVAKKYSHQYDI